MNKIYFKAGITIIITILCLIFIQSVSSEEIELCYSFDEPQITEVNTTNSTYHTVIMNDSDNIVAPGYPMLPVKPLKILLPQNGTLESINITFFGNTSIGQGYNLTLGPEIVAINSSQQNQSNQSCFNSSIPYPTELRSGSNVYGFRGYSILFFNLYPVHYIGDTGEIYYYENMNITILTNETGNASPLFRKLSSDEVEMKQMVDDYSMNSTYTFGTAPPDDYDLLIITKDSFIGGKRDGDPDYFLTFMDLVKFKNENTETKTMIESIENITSDEKYYTCEDDAERIRDYIKDCVNDYGINYVLLGGDSNIIPARKLWCYTSKKEEYRELGITSDLYYSCLDGSYNGNDNKWYGEPTDGESDDGNKLNEYEPIGLGLCYALANSRSSGLTFDVGLFTPPIDLSDYIGYDKVVLNFSSFFKERNTPQEFFKVKGYSGGKNPSNEIEILHNQDKSDSEKHGDQYEYEISLSEYEDKENIYLEFHYYNDEYGASDAFYCSLEFYI